MGWVKDPDGKWQLDNTGSAGLDFKGISALLPGVAGTNTNSAQTGNTTGLSTTTGGTTSTGTSASTTNQSGRSDTTTISSNQQANQMVSDAVSSMSGRSTQEQTSQVALSFLNQIMPDLMAKASSKEFSREQAITDSAGAIQQVIRNFKEQTLPKLYVAESGTGGYNSSAKTMMANDLATRAAEAAAAIQSTNIANYAQIQQGRENALLSGVNAAANAQRTTTGTTEQTGQEARTGSSTLTGSSNVGSTVASSGVTTNVGQTSGATTNNQIVATQGTAAQTGNTNTPGSPGTALALGALGSIGSGGFFDWLVKQGLNSSVAKGIVDKIFPPNTPAPSADPNEMASSGPIYQNPPPLDPDAGFTLSPDVTDPLYG
jgi:hypothetical protein